MSSNAPLKEALYALGKALLAAIKGLHPIFRFILAFAILVVMIILLRATIPRELMPIFYILPALGLVGYLVLEIRVLILSSSKSEGGGKPGREEQ